MRAFINKVILWCNIICWDMDLFIKDMAPYMQGLLLDVGCGEKQPRFTPRRYIGVDVPQAANKKIEVYASALRLPFKDGRFDSVACLSVLEHVPEPQQAVDEIFRVLKKGGYCGLIVPLINRIHLAPYDYFRFTRYGVEHVLTKAGFQVVKIQDGGGMWKMFGARFAGYLYSDLLGMGYAQHDATARRKPYLLPLVAPLIVLTVAMARLLDKVHCVRKDTVHYYVLCKKA